ncbi:hypothetical protein B0J13DRAFT_449828 [Dactylonectria estremocensis]|uniref:Zn(2)-C6 fungal-type domain-containing protein n=1 Tax=Dactylonectria estremocensis TaxID=1079267 RepID=A0A9P9EHX2_9HYPO|nr:hypothetical protein B0J13DRAFT_449828 [Dactylonectria estremocensis]
MPIPRKSCDACFRGRRRCDLAYPVCTRCQRNKRQCHYSSSVQTPRTPESPEHSAVNSLTVSDSQAMGGSTSVNSTGTGYSPDLFDFNLDDTRLVGELLNTSVPNMLGPLGDFQPVTGRTESWKWVLEQLKSYPKAFAQDAETPFIHKSLIQGTLPRPIRAAFGVCSAYTGINDNNRAIIFRLLDAEVSDVLSTAKYPTLLEELASTQALVLYQILRLFDGGIDDRALAEQQQCVLRVRALKVLQRAETELGSKRSTWEIWIMNETIRRTVMVAFIIFGVDSAFKHDICPEIPTLAILPLSANQSFWNSEESFMRHSHEDKTIRYTDFTALWLASPPRRLDPFERLILVACKGLQSVDTFSIPDDESLTMMD